MRAIKVKDILELLKTVNPEATIDFYHYGTEFSASDIKELRVLYTDLHVDLYVTDKDTNCG